MAVSLRFESFAGTVPGRGFPTGYGMTTDTSGRIELRHFPGRVKLKLDGIDAPQVATIRPGVASEARFTIESGSVQARFVDSNGESVNDVLLASVRADTARLVGPSPRRLRPGRWSFVVLPAALHDLAKRRAGIREAGSFAALARRVGHGLGEIDLRAGQVLRATYELPDGLGY